MSTAEVQAGRLTKRQARSIGQDDASRLAAHLIGAASVAVPLAAMVPFIKYYIYALPVIMGLVWILARGRPQRLNTIPLVASFLLACQFIFSGYSIDRMDDRFVANMVFIGTPIITATFIPAIRARDVKIVVFWVVAAFFISAIPVVASSSGAFNFQKSQGLLESTMAFPLGALAIYFVSRGDKKEAILLLVLTILAFKRIAILAVFAAVAYDYVSRLAFLSERLVKLGSLAFLTVCCVVSFFYFDIVGWALEVTGSRASLNEISSGRYDLTKQVLNILAMQPPQTSLFGLGLGAGEKLALIITHGRISILHNDFLRLAVELGRIGSIVMLAVIAVLHTRNRVGAVLLIYTSILFITDNTLSYAYHFSIIYLLSSVVSGPSDFAPRRASVPGATF